MTVLELSARLTYFGTQRSIPAAEPVVSVSTRRERTNDDSAAARSRRPSAALSRAMISGLTSIRSCWSYHVLRDGSPAFSESISTRPINSWPSTEKKRLPWNSRPVKLNCSNSSPGRRVSKRLRSHSIPCIGFLVCLTLFSLVLHNLTASDTVTRAASSEMGFTSADVKNNFARSRLSE